MISSARLALLFILACLFTTGSMPGQKTPLFDQSHGQKFSPSNSGPLDLSAFASVAKKAGFRIALQTKPITANALKNASAFDISGAFREEMHKGKIFVIGDDACLSNSFVRDSDNFRFARNLAAWLAI